MIFSVGQEVADEGTHCGKFQYGIISEVSVENSAAGKIAWNDRPWFILHQSFTLIIH